MVLARARNHVWEKLARIIPIVAQANIAAVSDSGSVLRNG
jgi:hypothetical protein